MNMAFTFMVWNVEKFKTDNETRIRKISDKIHEHKPDIFGLLEFKARKSARKLVTDYFPDYDFAFTFSKMNIEILMGWKRGKFQQVIYTQRRDLAATVNLRPGGLISFQQKGNRHFNNILFLHLDSGTTKKDYENRQEMYKNIWKMNKAIKSLPTQNNKSRLIALGDLNVMGRKLGPAVTAEQEFSRLNSAAKRNGMGILDKSYEHTWKGSGRYPDSDLDHVIASNDLKFDTWKYPGENNIWEIEVDGWNRLDSEAERRKYAREVSDHSPLIGWVGD